MGWIDIIVLVIVIVMAIIGLAKGLFESILSLFGSALALGISIWVCKPVAQFFNKMVNITGFITNLLQKGPSEDGFIKILGFSYEINKAAHLLTIVLTVVIVFILIKLVIWLLAKLFDKLTSSSSTLSGLNHLLGLVFGAAKGLVFVAISLAVVSAVSKVAFTETINAAINDPSSNNQITKFAYKYVDDGVEKLLQKYLPWLIGNPTADE